MSNLVVAEKRQGSYKQLARYALVGFVSNSAGYLVYLLVTYLGATPKITMSVLYGLGATIGYIGNRNFTFSHKGSLLGTSVRYLISHFFGYIINLIILVIFVDHFMCPHQLVQAIAIFIVAAVLFMSFKVFVFPVQNETIKEER